MVWIGCILCEKFRRHFVARPFALHQFGPICTESHAVTKCSQMHPNIMKRFRTRVCLRCEEFRRHFVAQPSALIAPVRPDLHRVSHSNEMVPKAPKHYETHQNMSLGFNGMDRVPSLRKVPMRLRCTNFCINCTSLA